MAIGVLFEFPGVTRPQYDAVVKRLTNGRMLTSLSDWPVEGVLAHVAGPTPNGWRVVDVWKSEADLMKFAETLMPILKEMGFPEHRRRFFRRIISSRASVDGRSVA
jgi:hypothetical protein